MKESQIRTSVFIIILIAAAGIGAYVWIRSGSISTDVIPSLQDEESREPQEQRDPSTSLGMTEGAARDDKEIVKTGSPKMQKLSQTPTEPAPKPPAPFPVIPAQAGTQSPNKLTEDQLKSALAKAADSEDYTALGTALAEIYKRYPEGKKEYIEIESRAYVKATSYLDQEKNVERARAAADAVYSKYPFGWRFKYLRVRVLERLGRDAFAAGDLASAEKHALTMLGMEFRPEGANLMADIYLKRIDDVLTKGDKVAAQAAYDEIKDYQVSPDRRKALDERFQKILGL